MRVVLAVLAIATSVFMLGWIGLRDAKRLAAQAGEAAARTALGTKQRRLLALGAVLPGLLLMLSGWWSSTMMWMGATVILLWLWVVWLSRTSTRALAVLACVVLAASNAPDASADPPEFAGPGNRDCADCPELVIVPAGEFQMGSPDSEAGRTANEGPAHTVKFAKPFAIGKYEVTFDEWDTCVAEKACQPVADDGWGRGRRPVIFINLEMAQGYARWLSKKTGRDYRVPSEAEWEYAARGGSTTPWFWGSDSKQACEFGNVGDQSIAQEHPDWPRHDCNDGYSRTSPVGSFKPNGFGVHDTVGNVWEWVEDCFNPTYEGAPADGRAWLTGDCVRRVDRGGGWYNKPEAVRSALRYAGDDPKRQNNTLGFRIVRR